MPRIADATRCSVTDGRDRVTGDAATEAEKRFNAAEARRRPSASPELVKVSPFWGKSVRDDEPSFEGAAPDEHRRRETVPLSALKSLHCDVEPDVSAAPR